MLSMTKDMFGINAYALSGLGDSWLWGIILNIPHSGMLMDYALSGLLRINSPERAVYHNDGLCPSDGRSPSKKKKS